LTDPSADTRVALTGVGKRYVRFEDAPLLLGRAMRRGRGGRRDHLWALRGVDLAVAPGESIGVVGRNGSGKSTLLRLLAGVSRPTEGRVRVRGRIAPLISVGVGFHPELTGRENVYVNGTILGLTRAEIDARFDEIVDFAEIADAIDTPVKFYSSGMFVRLGFAVAVVAEPDVLLIDEVLAVGDIAFQLKCYRRMEEIRASGATLVVVSHNLQAIRVLAPRSIVLHDGELRYDGPSEGAISLLHDLLATHGGGTTDGHGTEAGACTVESFELLGSDGTRTAHVAAGDPVTFALQVRFEREVVDPIFGFSISTEAGHPAYTESTPWTGTGTFAAGRTATFHVRLTPRLASGSYVAAAGVRGHDGTDLHRRVDPVLFFVAGRDLVSGVADLGGSLEVT
jgi:ABC-type polysaccharide/polyol phosphate transport system ATPase subunit